MGWRSRAKRRSRRSLYCAAPRWAVRRGGGMSIHLSVAAPEDRAQWAKRIGESWRDVLDDVLATGKALVEAKAELPHGEFEAMIAADLPFEASTARRLMAI